MNRGEEDEDDFEDLIHQDVMMMDEYEDEEEDLMDYNYLHPPDQEQDDNNDNKDNNEKKEPDDDAVPLLETQTPLLLSQQEQEEEDLGERLPSNNNTDIFSFERYNNNLMWRPETNASPDTMKAKQFAQKRATTAPSSKTSVFRITKQQEKQKQRTFLSHTLHTNTSCVQLLPKRMAFHPIPGTKSVSMTLGDGQRLYMKQQHHSYSSTTTSTTSTASNASTNNSLGESMRAIRARVDRRRRQAVTSPSHATPSTLVNIINNNKLWVDKHAPTSWSHLLSDEQVNRQVLKALKAWDPYVFKRPAPANNNNHFPPNQSHNRNYNKSTDDTRPPVQQRVILLFGPPGTGKTTLAHWVAQHAGYRPLEINGSEERSAAVLRQQISRAMESSTLDHHYLVKNNTHTHRPNCLILDEIDGADAKGTIQAIVQLIQATSKQKHYLRRPILFLCNHKFAPALRPLLPFAKQFQVHPPEPSRLVQRLQGILVQERCVMSQPNLLHELVSETAGDIRSCLFTLQWARAAAVPNTTTNGVDVTRALEHALRGTGLKDAQNDVASCLTTIFRREKKRHAKEGSSCSVDQVLHSVDRFGDSSKVLDCLFLNVSQVSYVDPTLDRCATIYEWMSASDLFRSSFAELHVLTAAGAAHVLGRVERPPKLNFSTRFFSDMRYQHEGHVALLQRFAENRPQCQLVSACRAVMETIPYAMAIVAPLVGMNIHRTVTSVEVLNPMERMAFDKAAHIMIGLGLSYVAFDDFTENSFGGSSCKAMRMEPPVDRLTTFEGSPSLQSQIQLPMKELLASAIATRKIQSQQLPDENNSPIEELCSVKDRETPVKSIRTTEQVLESGNTEVGQRSIANASNFLTLGAKQAKAARSARSAARAGIDRSLKRQKTSHSGSGVPISHVVRLKYVKGFTQAVRTPCYPEDL